MAGLRIVDASEAVAGVRSGERVYFGTAAADRGEVGWNSMRAFAGERRAEAEKMLERIRRDGPLAASDFETGRSRSGWWEWGDSKRALEWLFWAGHVTTHSRRGSFERVYDLTERVIPPAILARPTPTEAGSGRSTPKSRDRATSGAPTRSSSLACSWKLLRPSAPPCPPPWPPPPQQQQRQQRTLVGRTMTTHPFQTTSTCASARSCTAGKHWLSPTSSTTTRRPT